MNETLVPVFLMVAVAGLMAGGPIAMTHAKDWSRGTKTFVGRLLGPRVPIDRTPLRVRHAASSKSKTVPTAST